MLKRVFRALRAKASRKVAPSLLTLPQEILLQICAYSLPKITAVAKVVCCCQHNHHMPHRIFKACFKEQFPTLYTCRLLSEITSSILYSVPAYQLHIASPCKKWQPWNQRWQKSLLTLHGGELRKVLLFVELDRGLLCCKVHCPWPEQFSRTVCTSRRRITQAGAIWLCQSQLQQTVAALVKHRKLKIEELVVCWEMSRIMGRMHGNEERIASTILTPLKELRGWVKNVSVEYAGWESNGWVTQIVKDIIFDEA